MLNESSSDSTHWSTLNELNSDPTHWSMLNESRAPTCGCTWLLSTNWWPMQAAEHQQAVAQAAEHRQAAAQAAEHQQAAAQADGHQQAAAQAAGATRGMLDEFNSESLILEYDERIQQ